MSFYLFFSVDKCIYAYLSIAPIYKNKSSSSNIENYRPNMITNEGKETFKTNVVLFVNYISKVVHFSSHVVI